MTSPAMADTVETFRFHRCRQLDTEALLRFWSQLDARQIALFDAIIHLGRRLLRCSRSGSIVGATGQQTRQSDCCEIGCDGS